MGAPQQMLSSYGGGGSSSATIPTANVIALLQFDGTTTTFVDSGPNGITVTPAGAATQATVAGCFGVGKGLESPTYSDHVTLTSALFCTATFSINFRYTSDSHATLNQALVDLGGYPTGISCRTAFGGGTQFSVFVDAVERGATVTWPSNGTFIEVEICQTGGTQYLFKDGVLLGSYPGMATLTGTPSLRIGGFIGGGSVTNTQRHFDDCLVTNTCLHTTSYTPRTTPYTIV